MRSIKNGVSSWIVDNKVMIDFQILVSLPVIFVLSCLWRSSFLNETWTYSFCRGWLFPQRVSIIQWRTAFRLSRAIGEIDTAVHISQSYTCSTWFRSIALTFPFFAICAYYSNSMSFFCPNLGVISHYEISCQLKSGINWFLVSFFSL